MQNEQIKSPYNFYFVTQWKTATQKQASWSWDPNCNCIWLWKVRSANLPWACSVYLYMLQLLPLTGSLSINGCHYDSSFLEYQLSSAGHIKQRSSEYSTQCSERGTDVPEYWGVSFPLVLPGCWPASGCRKCGCGWMCVWWSEWSLYGMYMCNEGRWV